ncbi:MAG: hypothetical protein ABIJ12_07825 [bacterium]
MDLNIISQIRVVDHSRILPFECLDIKDDISDISLDEMKLIHHPFLVTRFKNDYMLLNDTSYYESLKRAGLKHFPVQVVSPVNLDCQVNKLGLIGFKFEHLQHLAGKFPSRINISQNKNGFPNDHYLKVEFQFDNGSNLQKQYAFLRHSSRFGCPHSLENLFRAIRSYGDYIPIIERNVSDSSLMRICSLSGTMLLPSFNLNDINSALESDNLFPPNIIEAKSDCRILNIDFPLSVLLSNAPTDEKELFFKELVNLRLQSRKFSYHEGQVYIFNY